MTAASAEAVVQAQLDAYNAKDIERLLACYAPTAEQWVLHGGRLAVGHGAIRARLVQRFAEPDLQARLLARTVVGNVVADTERITRNFPEGRGTVEMLCVYEIVDGAIARASFATAQPVLDAPGI